MARSIGLLLVINVAFSALSASAAELDPAQAYRVSRTGVLTTHVDFSAVVTAPYKTKVLKVWLPLPPSDDVQVVRDRQLSSFPQVVTPQISKESVYGNEFAYFEFHSPQGGQIVRHTFTAETADLAWHVKPDEVQSVDAWPRSFEPYLAPQADVSQDAKFRGIVGELGTASKSEFARLHHVIDWVDENLKYDHAHASLQADAAFAFRERRGHCSDYHGLCATMGRALGFPTRVTYGLNLFPKSSPSHCKLEAFLPPYGWVSFDVSETQKLAAKIRDNPQLSASDKDRLTAAARNRLLSGFRDRTWLLVTRGTDYQLSPPAVKPVRVIRTIYAEADGTPLREPDPANPERTEFSWMTVHDFRSDRAVEYTFDNPRSLEDSPAKPDGSR